MPFYKLTIDNIEFHISDIHHTERQLNKADT